MKDSYTLDIDRQGIDTGFEKHRAAYKTIFARLGLSAVDVEASSGAMGGSESVEFIQRSEAGEDLIVTCARCDYRANLEKATSAITRIDDGASAQLERFPTPGLRTIASLAEAHPDVAAPDRQLKSLIYIVDGTPLIVMLRGDHELHEQKLIDATLAGAVRPASADEIRELFGADAGSLGAVGVSSVPVLADLALEGRFNMTTGANENDWHYKGVDVGRDIVVDRWADLRTVTEGESCIKCGSPLDRWKGIEVGHIFKLGTEYSETFGAYVQDETGESRPIIMGSYGIGVERNMAAAVEANHDDAGIIWPVSIAPYEVVITVLRIDDQATMEAAEGLYHWLLDEGIDALIDDRDERPGVKFADSELIGIPYRLTVGPRGTGSGTVEFTTRRGLQTTEVALADVGALVRDLIRTGRGASDPSSL